MPQTKVTQYETTDWTDLSTAPNTVTANGNRSYSLVFNSVDYTGLVQPGTRIRTTRTVAAPNQSASLNGTNQYFSKSSPAGMTFTDDFVVSAWIKLNNYTLGTIASRYNGTSGWRLTLSDGAIFLQAWNNGISNVSYVQSYQSVPLNKWVHITAQLDMSAFTATTTTSYIMIDGIDVPAKVVRSGTNPTALIQAGNLEVGSDNGGSNPFPGKIAQVTVYPAKVTQATIREYSTRAITSSDAGFASSWSLSGASGLTDINAGNANNLTAQNSATTTNADSPFGGQASGSISTTLDYGIVQSATFSTNTTVVVQVPEGNTIPTSGGVTTVSYSGLRSPYGMPSTRDKWYLTLYTVANINGTTNSTAVQNPAGLKFLLPIGSWVYSGKVGLTIGFGSSAGTSSYADIGTSSSVLNDYTSSYFYVDSQTAVNVHHAIGPVPITISSATNLYILAQTARASSTSFYIETTTFVAENAYL